MKQAEQIQEWLARWGKQVGADLGLDAGGQCAFVFDQLHFQLGLYDDEQSLLLAAVVYPGDVSAQPAVMKTMLQFAHLGGQSHRCGLSLAGSGEPVLWHWQRTQVLDEAQFSNLMSGFVATAQNTRTVITAAASPAAEAVQERPVDMSMLMQRV
ncbi:hypothetical protein SDC9_122622 [bioreactor metagenome]|uniref:Type III secretion chaperone SycN n=1 Tax=bioreactor metagenome TaxID=1076179 RepID=A0A645CFF3_9ZZZZ